MLSCLPIVLPCAALAQSQGYPSRTVKLIVPYGAGGSTDVTARILADGLSKSLGQSVIVENRPSASGIRGVESVAQSDPDGYTLLFANASTQAINPHLYSKPPYDAIGGFTPISMVSTSELMIAVNANLPVKTLPELIQFAKASPGKLNFGSNVGSILHLAGELFSQRANVQIVHIPYKSNLEALNDLIAGHIQVIFDTIPGTQPQLISGKVRAIAVASSKRSDLLSDVPTAAEGGLADYEVATWAMLQGPAGLPKEVVEKLNRATVEAVSSSEVQQRFSNLGITPAFSSPEQAREILERDYERWGKIVRQLNLKVN